MVKETDDSADISVRVEDETVWLSIAKIAELFNKSRSTINEHIHNKKKKEELPKEGTMRKIGNSDFSTKPTNYYNLDVIISVGYRVKSVQGTRFKQKLKPNWSIKNIKPKPWRVSNKTIWIRLMYWVINPRKRAVKNETH